MSVYCTPGGALKGGSPSPGGTGSPDVLLTMASPDPPGRWAAAQPRGLPDSSWHLWLHVSQQPRERHLDFSQDTATVWPLRRVEQQTLIGTVHSLQVASVIERRFPLAVISHVFLLIFLCVGQGKFWGRQLLRWPLSDSGTEQ